MRIKLIKDWKNLKADAIVENVEPNEAEWLIRTKRGVAVDEKGTPIKVDG